MRSLVVYLHALSKCRFDRGSIYAVLRHLYHRLHTLALWIENEACSSHRHTLACMHLSYGSGIDASSPHNKLIFTFIHSPYRSVIDMFRRYSWNSTNAITPIITKAKNKNPELEWTTRPRGHNSNVHSQSTLQLSANGQSFQGWRGCNMSLQDEGGRRTQDRDGTSGTSLRRWSVGQWTRRCMLILGMFPFQNVSSASLSQRHQGPRVRGRRTPYPQLKIGGSQARPLCRPINSNPIPSILRPSMVAQAPEIGAFKKILM